MIVHDVIYYLSLVGLVATLTALFVLCCGRTFLQAADDLRRKIGTVGLAVFAAGRRRRDLSQSVILLMAMFFMRRRNLRRIPRLSSVGSTIFTMRRTGFVRQPMTMDRG